MRGVNGGAVCSLVLSAMVLWAIAGCSSPGSGGTVLPDGAALADAPGGDSSASDGVGSDAAGLDGSGATDTADVEDHACPPPTGARPPRLSEHGGVYDPIGQQVLIFGGSTAVPQQCDFPEPTFEGTTWLLDVRCGQWRKANLEATARRPSARVRHMMAYDSTRRRALLFGGRERSMTGDYTIYDDVWAFDFASETWSELAITTGPSGRVNGAFVYDPAGDRAILFGGNDAPSSFPYAPRADIWVLDVSAGTWSMMDVPGPTKRLFTAALWDAERTWLVHFGGGDETAFNPTVQYFETLWALDLAAETPIWRQLDFRSAATPPGRFWGGLVHDAARNRYVLHGGHDDGGDQDVGNRNDVWAFDLGTFEWSELIGGDTFNKGAIDFCLFPPDFAVTDFDSPERRNAHVFVAGPDAAFSTGGKTDCGSADDAWRFDFETDTWSELVPATVGETCIRKGGVGCSEMCL